MTKRDGEVLLRTDEGLGIFFPLLWTDGRGSRGFGNSPADEADLCGLGCVWTFRVAFGLGWIWGFWLGEARDR